MEEQIVAFDYPQVILPPQPNVTNALKRIRKEWQEASEGKSLIDANTSVGFFLGDICNALCLSEQEQEEVLGSELYHELKQV